jgi:hypothetical protein
MSHLMRHDEQDLIRAELGQHRVPQHDSLAGSDACNIRVDGPGIHTLVDLVHPASGNAGAVRQGQNSGLHCAIGHPVELVEQRIDPERRDNQNERRDRCASQPCVQPPVPRASPQQQVGDPENQREADATDHHGLYPVAEPLPEALSREAVPVWPHESFVVCKGQGQKGVAEGEQHCVEKDGWKPAVPSQPVGQVS